MITINKFAISQDFKTIEIRVEEDAPSFALKDVIIYTRDTYGKVGFSLKTHILQPKSFIYTLSAEEFGVDAFSGIYILKVTSVPTDTTVRESVQVGIAANIFKYKQCLLDKVLKNPLSGCNDSIENCQEKEERICYINSLLSSLDFALKEIDFLDAIKITEELDVLCDICHSCDNDIITQDNKNKNILYQTDNNSIFLNESEKVMILKKKLLQALTNQDNG